MEDLKPMLFTCLKKYSKEQFIKDLIAGIIVAIIALPLSIALALASGVGPERGIYTAVIAGFVISFLGGSQVQIAGPTAAFATIVAGIVADQGMDGLAVATILAGIILILMGFCRLGSLIKFIPYTITTGFTAGIAVTIAIGQLKDFCGVTIPVGMPTIETMEKLEGFLAGIGTLNWHAVSLWSSMSTILIFGATRKDACEDSTVISSCCSWYFNGEADADSGKYNWRSVYNKQQPSIIPFAKA